MRLSAGYLYVAWQTTDYAHITADHGQTTLCGAVNNSPANPLVTADPMGKPRCFECLQRAGIEPLFDEPTPVPKEVPTEEPQRPTPTQDLPLQPVVPELRMPPPGFFDQAGNR